MSCTTSRTSRTVSNEACEATSVVIGAVTRATPPWTAGLVGSPSPSTSSIAAATSKACPTSETTMIGVELSASPCSASTSCPTMESYVWVYCSSDERPVASSSKSPRHATARTAAVPIQTLRARGAIQRPTLAHQPDDVGSGEPNAGRFGQNTHLPTITSSAGSRVTITRKVTATPIALTGPRPAVEFRSASERQSMPSTTVAALARIAGVARCSANAMASCRSSWRRSSSR